MPAANESWTVLPHDPIQKHSPTFWTVHGTLADGKTKRTMSIAKMRDGRLAIHNGIALEEPLMQEIEALGAPGVLIVPGGYHRLDAKVFKQRYPAMKVYCPAGAKGRVSQVVTVDGGYADAPRDESFSLTDLDGTKSREGVLEARGDHGTALVFNDAINNLALRGGLWGFILAPTGRPSVPRLARWLMVSDKPALRAHLDRLAGLDGLSRIVVSHGEEISADAPRALRSVGAELAG